MDKTVRGRARTERGNTRSGATLKREISRTLSSINLHLVLSFGSFGKFTQHIERYRGLMIPHLRARGRRRKLPPPLYKGRRAHHTFASWKRQRDEVTPINCRDITFQDEPIQLIGNYH